MDDSKPAPPPVTEPTAAAPAVVIEPLADAGGVSDRYAAANADLVTAHAWADAQACARMRGGPADRATAAQDREADAAFGVNSGAAVEATWEAGDAVIDPAFALGQMVDPRNLHEQWCGTCRRRLADKSAGDGRPVCHRCAAGVVETARGPSVPAGRNAPCPCGSGRKFKKCHRRAVA